jgi:excisionase family DNA binding protein
MTTRTGLLTLSEAAQELSVSYWTVRKWALEGMVGYVRLPGGSLRMKPEEVKRIREAAPNEAVTV